MGNGTAVFTKSLILQSAQAGNANGTPMRLQGEFSVAMLEVFGTFTGTVNFEASRDGGVTFRPLAGRNLATGEQVNSATAPGLFRFNVSFLDEIQARTSGMSAGSVSVVARVSPDGLADDLLPGLSAALVDGASNPSAQQLAALSHLFNGATWDRERNNTEVTVFASAARTATLNSADFTNYDARGLHLVIDVTSITLTPSVTFTIQGKDPLSGKYYTILASAAITAVGTTVLRVFPGSTVTANLKENDILPRTWRVNAAHLDADSITYSVGALLVK